MYSVRPWSSGSVWYRAFVRRFVCLEKVLVNTSERASELSHAVASSYPQCFVSIGRFIRRSIRTAPAATRLKPSGENIVSDLASPPATTSLLLAMISYSTSRVRERNKERNRVETGKRERKRGGRGKR